MKWPVAPNLHRVALVWNPTNPVVAEEVNQIRHIAPKLGLEIQTLALLPPNIGGTLAAISAAGVDGLILANDAVVESFASRLIPFAAERQLPAIWGSGFAPMQGALMSYSSDSFALGQRAAHYVDRILKGTSPSDLPIEQTTVFTLRINLKTAKALGLTVPSELLATADEVIE